MRYIVTPQEMRAAEQAAFDRGVSSLLLMETAARQAFEALRETAPAGGKTVFLCGPGNNGGDGLAMARMWRLAGGQSAVVLPEPPRTPDAQVNLRYVQALGIPILDQSPGEADAIVDALFGTGFRGAVDRDSAMGRLIAWANSLKSPILSVDIPSGMDGLTGAAEGLCVRADQTVTFHAAKRGLIFTPCPENVGKLLIADIGLPHREGISWADDLAELLPPRRANAHKGDCGRVLIFAGNLGMAGAAQMAAAACLRAGSGLVTVVCPREIIPILQKTVPNAMCRAAEEQPEIRCDVKLFGCGLSETEESWQALLRLHHDGEREVWDAGALNLLAKHPMALGEVAVITPHLGEAARLLGWSIDQIALDPPQAAHALVKKYHCGVVLKSAASVICGADGQLAVNALPAPALAKGGSGDALAGILASLLGQGLPPMTAMQAACLWHSLA
ncbi:MAG: NAD(P)H-hydrate dehydratase, partial [Clostridia bacterium]|nr:NAD(P)H-hydrate dehydratase [Clostridia bacterium]